jgi:hypothetical protein
MQWKIRVPHNLLNHKRSRGGLGLVTEPTGPVEGREVLLSATRFCSSEPTNSCLLTKRGLELDCIPSSKRTDNCPPEKARNFTVIALRDGPQAEFRWGSSTSVFCCLERSTESGINGIFFPSTLADTPVRIGMASTGPAAEQPSSFD